MDYIALIKRSIDKGEDIKVYLNEVASLDSSSPFDFIFQKVYLHTCLCIGINKMKGNIELMKKQEAIHKFLIETCYPMLPEIQRIAIRQVFAYGNKLRK